MRFRIPPLSTLRLFEAAGRARSFADAAREVGVTASAVSHAIQSLEDWLGATLFARKRGTLRLTPAGAEYHAAVREAFQILTRELPAPRPNGNRLRLTVVPTFAERLLIPRLSAFCARYQEVALSIDTSHRLAKFPGDGFDAGIRLGTGDWPGLFVHRLLTENLVPVCAPGFVPDDTDIATLPDDLLIYVTSTDDGWADFATANGRPRPDPQRGLRVDTMQIALAAATQGMGIALARLPTAADEISKGRLSALSNEPVPCRQSYFFVTAPEAASHPLIQAMLEWLIEEMDRLRTVGGAA
jgi:LysR family glycine cleavage system transcriptional activator